MRTAKLLLLAPAAAQAAHPSECFSTRSRELAARTSCGDEGSITYCFSQLATTVFESIPATGNNNGNGDGTEAEYLAVWTAMNDCLVNAGCTPDEAQIEAYWTIRQCAEAESPSASGSEAEFEPESELKKKREAEEAQMQAAMPVARDPAAAAMITAVAAPVDGVLRRADSTTLPLSPSPCSTTSSTTVTVCPTQSTGTASGKQLSCYPTTTPVEVCVEGLLCMLDRAGTNVCMYKDNNLGASGIAVSIYFGVTVTIAVVSMCFFGCRARSTERKLAKAAEAAALAREQKKANARADPVAQPLVSRGPGGGYQGLHGDEADAGDASNPFVDQHPALR